ncbi:alpha/beta hydrolase family protein [Comamonas composti]|uniref:hypothetical protein n=1 Tax=Comamonas composti TaxID=408558 RepID=UPI001FE13F32|nr:hypothetical protein [Comamonas composti]
MLLLMGCAQTPAPRGEVKGEDFGSGELLQSDSNRMATLAMKANLQSLMRLMDKLYQRNPAEWKKTADSREAAAAYVRIAIMERQPWAELQGRRDVAALSLALEPGFAGDRVAAFIHALADTLITAHGGRTSFTLINGLDPQLIYNAARNVEIANWILNTRRTATGAPLLLSNHLNEGERNLSFEREMGMVIGRLDLIASYTTERYRRSVIGYAQGLVAGPFFQFLPVQSLPAVQ